MDRDPIVSNIVKKSPDVVLHNNIYKYKRDKLDYKLQILKNGLNILYINDDIATQSHVCMNVKTGHNQNPPEYLGLAHFLEHMLFMGSKKYPQVDKYNKAITENHGSSNAYTRLTIQIIFFHLSNVVAVRGGWNDKKLGIF